MPTRNVNLTDELESFVLAEVESGRYENASEVVRAALRMLEREERQYEAKLAALRNAIDEGEDSGLAEGNAFDRVRQQLKFRGKTDRSAPGPGSELIPSGLRSSAARRVSQKKR